MTSSATLATKPILTAHCSPPAATHAHAVTKGVAASEFVTD